MRIIIILLLLLIFPVVKGQVESTSDEKSEKKGYSGVPDYLKNSQNNQIDDLKEYYEKALGKDSIKYMKLFFVTFPANFEVFHSLYGFDDKTGPMPLYGLYVKHIAFFCKLNTTQSETDYFNKLIKLGINGHWDADGVGALQQCILSHINEKPDLTITLLKQFKDSEIRSFWRFLFDGPHPEDKGKKTQFDTLHKNIELIDKRMADFMQIEYLRLIKDRFH